jgi:hypothetical protein
MEDTLQAMTGYATPETRAEKEWETKLMTCRHCRRQSRDRKEVSTFGYHVGGDAFPIFYEECANDITGCCQRSGR